MISIFETIILTDLRCFMKYLEGLIDVDCEDIEEKKKNM